MSTQALQLLEALSGHCIALFQVSCTSKQSNDQEQTLEDCFASRYPYLPTSQCPCLELSLHVEAGVHELVASLQPPLRTLCPYALLFRTPYWAWDSLEDKVWIYRSLAQIPLPAVCWLVYNRNLMIRISQRKRAVPYGSVTPFRGFLR